MPFHSDFDYDGIRITGPFMCDHLRELSLSMYAVMEDVLEKGYTEKWNILCPIGYTVVHVRIKEKQASASMLLPSACDSY